MNYLAIYAALCVGVMVGYVLCAVLRRNDERYPPVQSVEVQHVTPQAMTAMAHALSHAGEMLNSGDFEYLSGGIMVNDLGHGVVNIRGDLSLRAAEVKKAAPKGRDFIGMKRP